jgi:hypothetical protein
MKFQYGTSDAFYYNILNFETKQLIAIVEKEGNRIYLKVSSMTISDMELLCKFTKSKRPAHV